ncbi:hypothetical protein C8R43DRAFT_1127890 [Mycena crocata]|nr:hypothetical protein C8R43DRAFT_1127890 [Mycena crocata]
MFKRPTETDPLLAHGTQLNDLIDSQTPLQLDVEFKLLKLTPVVVLASVCRGMSMFSRYSYYKQPLSDVSRFFTIWVAIPGVTVKMDMQAMWASFIFTFISVGWWSALGDHRGRKPVDLIFLLVAGRNFQNDGVSVGLIIDGLLGGFASYNGVVHAYLSDVSSGCLSRTVIFAAFQALSFIFFRVGALLGLVAVAHCGPGGYAFSVFLALFNLAWIYIVLPESLTPLPREYYARPSGPSSLLKHVLSPFSIFLRAGPLRTTLLLVACSLYMYSLASALGVKIILFASVNGYFPALSRSLILFIPMIITMLTLMCIVPALAWQFKCIYGNTPTSGRHFARALAQYSVLIATLSSIGILVFGSSHTSTLFAVFFPLYFFSVGGMPALYSLLASYFIGAGRASEMGAMFGALSIWVCLGQNISYYMNRDSGGHWGIFYFLQWVGTIVCLVVSLLLLVPEDHSAQSDEDVAHQEEEHV